MDEAGKSTESKSTDRQLGAIEESIVESAARKVGSTIGGIAAKMSGASAKANANAYESRRQEAKKRKRSAHRRKLKSSHTKG